VRTSTVLLTFAALSSATPVTIDNFSVTQNLNLTALGTNPKNATPNGALGGIGGQREFSLTRTAGNGTASLNANVSPGFLSYSSSDNSNAQFLVVWDGTNTAASPSASLTNLTNLTFGLGNVDLTDNGLNDRIRFRADADNNGDIPITVRIYRSAGKYIQATTNVIGDAPFSLEFYELTYASFVGTGLSPDESVIDIARNANAIALFGNPPLASDMTIDFLESGVMIPEPTTFALIGSAVVGLGFARRRRLS
jgi:hypothetical protein